MVHGDRRVTEKDRSCLALPDAQKKKEATPLCKVQRSHVVQESSSDSDLGRMKKTPVKQMVLKQSLEGLPGTWETGRGDGNVWCVSWEERVVEVDGVSCLLSCPRSFSWHPSFTWSYPSSRPPWGTRQLPHGQSWKGSSRCLCSRGKTLHLWRNPVV